MESFCLIKQPVSPLTFLSVVEHVSGIDEKRLLYHELLMNEKIVGFYADPSQAAGTSGRTAAHFGGNSIPQSGRTAAVRALPGQCRTTPMSEVIPGSGPPSTEEMAQWKPGNVTRYSCCGRVQSCGLILSFLWM